MSSLALRFTGAVQWNVATSALGIIVQLAITVVLARVLTPSDFGKFAVANVVFVVATSVSQAGMVAAIIREPTLDRDVVGSVVGLSCTIYFFLAAAGLLIAPLA